MGNENGAVHSERINHASGAGAQDLAGQRLRDMDLVAGIVAGDDGCFERLHTLYRERIYRFALKRLGNPSEAEDVCQDVFLQVFRCAGSYEGRSSLLTWMFGITHHQVCRRHRRRSLETFSLDAPETAEASAEQVPADRQVEAARILADCGRVLNEKVNDSQRRVFHLRYARNFSTRAIARELGKSNQAVKISLFRTRRTLAAETADLAAVLSA